MRKPIALDWRGVETREFDVLICAAGYEKRSVYAAHALAPRASKRIAIEFGDRRVLSYSSNREWLEANNFVFYPCEFPLLEKELSSVINAVERDAIRIAVDVSSMTRPLIANLVAYFANRCAKETEVAFVYCPASFVPPSRQNPPQTYSGPVTPEYAGWTLDPNLPLSVVIGAGYEYGRALGILEYLEPAVAWVFNPAGISPLFDEALRKVNAGLYDLIPDAQIIDYPVNEALLSYERLEVLVNGLKRHSRVTLCPFGPKIFFLISVLVAEAHRPEVTVWRVSGGSSEVAQDHEASGEVITLPVRFEIVP